MKITEVRRAFPVRDGKLKLAEQTRCSQRLPSVPAIRPRCGRLGDLSYTYPGGRLTLYWCLRCLTEWLTELETKPYEPQLSVQKYDRIFLFEHIGDVSA